MEKSTRRTIRTNEETKKMINKRSQGATSIIWFITILFVLLLAGVALAFGSTVVNWVWDEAVPELTNLGMIGDANMTSIADSTIVPANSFVQSFTWLTGVIYIMALIACLGLAVAFRFTGNKWLAGFFIASMIMLVMVCVFISNIYEDFYDDTDEFGTRLKEHTLISFLILESPLIITILGFIGGIIMFTGDPSVGGL